MPAAEAARCRGVPSARRLGLTALFLLLLKPESPPGLREVRQWPSAHSAALPLGPMLGGVARSGRKQGWWCSEVVGRGTPRGVEGVVVSRGDKVTRLTSGLSLILQALLLMFVSRGIVSKLSPADGDPWKLWRGS